MKRLPPIRHKLNVKPNVIKFKFNHTAKFIYKIKFHHLQAKALGHFRRVLFGSRVSTRFKNVCLFGEISISSTITVLKGKL